MSRQFNKEEAFYRAQNPAPYHLAAETEAQRGRLGTSSAELHQHTFQGALPGPALGWGGCRDQKQLCLGPFPHLLLRAPASGTTRVREGLACSPVSEITPKPAQL